MQFRSPVQGPPPRGQLSFYMFLHCLNPMLRPEVLPMFPQHHPVGHAFAGHLHHVSHWAGCLKPEMHAMPAIQAEELLHEAGPEPGLL